MVKKQSSSTRYFFCWIAVFCFFWGVVFNAYTDIRPPKKSSFLFDPFNCQGQLIHGPLHPALPHHFRRIWKITLDRLFEKTFGGGTVVLQVISTLTDTWTVPNPRHLAIPSPKNHKVSLSLWPKDLGAVTALACDPDGITDL